MKKNVEDVGGGGDITSHQRVAAVALEDRCSLLVTMGPKLVVVVGFTTAYSLRSPILVDKKN